MQRIHFIRSMTVMALALCGVAATAQTFPSAPVKITSPFPAGSGPDAVARVIGEKLQEAWKQPVVIENKPGSAGVIAVEAAKRAPATGHDLLLADFGHLSVNPSIYRKLPYDVERELVPITLLYRTAFYIAVSASGPYASVKDLVAAAGKKSLNYGSNGVGGPLHLGGAQLAFATQHEMVHVAFKETSALYAALANNDLDFAFASIGSAGALLKAGKIKFLALADTQRSTAMPEVPTLAEAGGPKDVKSDTWIALMAPAGTPADVITSLNKTITAVMARPDVKQRLDAMGFQAVSSTPQELAGLIRSDRQKYGEIVKRLGSYID